MWHTQATSNEPEVPSQGPGIWRRLLENVASHSLVHSELTSMHQGPLFLIF
jgi:hypothetical protein